MPADFSTSVQSVKADLFRTLGHPVRVQILEVLRDRECSVGELQGLLYLDSSGASQHLALLRRQGLVEGRKDGASVLYRMKDRRTSQLLEVARQILSAHFHEAQALLEEVAPSSSPAQRGSGPSAA